MLLTAIRHTSAKISIDNYNIYVLPFTDFLVSILYLATRVIYLPRLSLHIIHTYTSQCMYMYRMQCSWYITEMLGMHIILKVVHASLLVHFCYRHKHVYMCIHEIYKHYCTNIHAEAVSYQGYKPKLPRVSSQHQPQMYQLLFLHNVIQFAVQTWIPSPLTARRPMSWAADGRGCTP